MFHHYRSAKPTNTSTPFDRSKPVPLSTVTRLSQTSAARSASPLVLQRIPPNSVQKSGASSKATAMRAIDFTADSRLESFLAEREARLRQRRAHVESLVRWHQRLDDEESAVAAMEAKLMACSNRGGRPKQLQQQKRQTPSEQSLAIDEGPSLQPLGDSRRRRSQQLQIQSIEHSLEVLHALPTSDGRFNCNDSRSAATADVERVSVSGTKMNRLWRRLTGETACKFIPERSYQLSKADISSIYEEAKRCVLGQFDDDVAGGTANLRGVRRELEQSVLSTLSTMGADMSLQQQPQRPHQTAGCGSPNVLVSVSDRAAQANAGACDEFIVVPALNLNFTSNEEQSASASDADVIGDAFYYGTTDTSAHRGLYYTDSVKSTAMIKRHRPEAPPTSAVSPTNAKSTSSGQTFAIQTPSSAYRVQANSFRDSAAFSIDSLNGSRNDLSERSAAGGVVEESFPGMSQTQGGEQNAEGVVSQEEAHRTVEQSPITPVATIDNHHQLAASYSESFEITATPIITTASDKISNEPITTVATMHDSQQQLLNITERSHISETEYPTVTDDEEGTSGVPTVLGSSQMSSTSVVEEVETKFDRVLSEDDQPSSLVIDNEAGELSESNKSSEKSAPASESKNVELQVYQLDTPPYKMPDIISEAEVLRRQQMRIEEEVSSAQKLSCKITTIKFQTNCMVYLQIKQLEEKASIQQLPLIREIPNKPPPPYVPPAHDSPMAALMPSDARIRDIVSLRVEELLLWSSSLPQQQSSSSAPLAAVDDSNITNIYERIALDMSAECVAELLAADAQPHFRRPLAFHNPPDRMQCMQKFVLQRVQKLLGQHSSAAAPALANPRRPQPTINYVKRLLNNSVSGSFDGHGFAELADSRRKLWWNDILLHEMMEDDATWTNFDTERLEVLDSVSEEIMRRLLDETLAECEAAFGRKAAAVAATKQAE